MTPSPVANPVHSLPNPPNISNLSVPTHLSMPAKSALVSQWNTSDKISLGSLIVTLTLVGVTYYSVRVNRRMVIQSGKDTKDTINTMKEVNRDNMKVSVLAMKHESMLTLFSVILSSFRGSLDFVDWALGFTSIDTFSDEEYSPTNPTIQVFVKTPKPEDYPQDKNINSVLDKFESMETKARIDLLGNDDLGLEVVRWITSFEIINTEWNQGVADLVEESSGPNSNEADLKRKLEELKRKIREDLQPLRMDIKPILDLMKKKIDPEFKDE